MGEVERGMKITSICVNLLENCNNAKYLSILKELLCLVKGPIIDHQLGPAKNSCSICSLVIIAVLKLAKKRKDDPRWPECEKILLLQIITGLYENNILNDIKMYFTISVYLLHEMDSLNKQSVLEARISEEYLLNLLECMYTITNAMSWDISLELYQKENVPKLSVIIFHVVTVIDQEKYRKLIILAIKTVMCLTRVWKDEELYDYELNNKVADVFVYYLPKVAVVLKKIATNDEKMGHSVICIAIKAWSRILMIMTRDYRSADEKLNILMEDSIDEDKETFDAIKLNNVEELYKYIQTRKRTPGWYRHTDENIHKIAEGFVRITNFNHHLVRRELIDMCSLLTKNCNNTLPKTISILIQIVIILTEDEDDVVRKKANVVLNDLTRKMNDNVVRTILENSEENFYQSVLKLPRIFNSFDENMQCRSLHLLLGYLRLFGQNKLVHLLHSTTHLNSLIASLVQISELDKSGITSLEEYNSADLQTDVNVRLYSWRNFHYFRNELVLSNIIAICGVLSQAAVIDIVTDRLLETFCNEIDQRKEATFLLNEIVSSDINDCSVDERLNRLEIIKNVINLYLEPNNWNLPFNTNVDDFGISHTIGEVQNNILQICLQLDGIGKMALICKEQFNDLLLKTLYPILEKIGSGNVFLKESALRAIVNVAKACGFKDVTELINKNSDYFSFYIVRKLKAIERNRNVLNVFSVVMKYSNIDVLPYISDIAEGLLMDSCDLLYNQNPNDFLRFFKIFINCLKRWLKIKRLEVPIKSLIEKEREIKEFQLTDIKEYKDFTDETVMKGKTAEEMYKEDMLKKVKEIDELNPEVEEYKKPEAPTHVKLTVLILKKSLNYLPSKDKSTKVLTLDILNNGLEVIRDYEDELLPVVHLIWSPLVERFKETQEPIIVNLSFQLLETLARLSKDFIRSRTSKDVLPLLLNVLGLLAKESYLKDKGAVYRYTQAYKLQEIVIKNLGKVLSYLDSQEEDFLKSSETIALYLSNKQPLPLQDGAIEFYRTVEIYQQTLFENLLRKIDYKEINDNEYKNNVKKISSS